MIRYLLEYMGETEFNVYPSPVNDIPKNYNIYYLDLKDYPTENNYWIEWGGYFDNYIGTQLELYYGDRLLRKVYEYEELFLVPYSMLVLPDKALINIPSHPWHYPDQKQYGLTMNFFLSSSLKDDNPSYNIIREGLDIAPIKLNIPDFTIKLSESINGIMLNQGLSVSLINNDGFFDNENRWNKFNFPIYLKRAIVNNPIYTDFKIIRSGFIESTNTTFDNFQIDIADKLKSMNRPVCKIITRELFPYVVFDEEKNDINKNIPIIYGTKKTNLLRLNETTFTAAEYIDTIHKIYDKNNNELSFSYNKFENIIITENTAVSALITGYPDNKIGEIIINLILNKTDIEFLNTYFDIEETEKYIINSPKINTIINSGNLNSVIQNILKSDMAYFIQKINDKFTIRKYGEFYNEHNIKSWLLTKNKRPRKSYDKANENYFSNCIIKYNFNDDNFESYYFNNDEIAKEKYNSKIVNRVFETELIDIEDVKKLAILLSDRYSILKQTVEISVGTNTGNYELLDRINLELNINDREFSQVKTFFIKEINPSQDILILEEI